MYAVFSILSQKLLRHLKTLFSRRFMKVFPVFPRNIPYRARPKCPPFQFFSAMWDFSETKISPLQFFDVLRQNGCWKTPKGPPFSFSAVRLFSKIYSPKGPPSTATKMLTISEVSPFSAPGARASEPRRATRSIFFAFSIFQYCKLTLGSPFAIFEPWIWRRLEPVPAC